MKSVNYSYMNKQIIDNINNNNELINNDLMFGYTNYKLIQLLVMLLSKLYKLINYNLTELSVLSLKPNITYFGPHVLYVLHNSDVSVTCTMLCIN